MALEEGNPFEATFMVLADIVQALVQNGALRTEQLEVMARAFEIQTAQTAFPEKRADCKLASELMGVLASLSGEGATTMEEVRHPILRVVRDNPESDDAQD